MILSWHPSRLSARTLPVEVDNSALVQEHDSLDGLAQVEHRVLP